MKTLSPTRKFVAIAASLLIALPATFAIAAGASAAPIDAPVLAAASEPFNITCAGTTLVNPATSGLPGFRDLTRIEGKRLDVYNAGGIVPIYDAFGGGGGDYSAFPALCGVHKDVVNGEEKPVAEWLFCTDYQKAVCGAQDNDGVLAEDSIPNKDLVPVDYPLPLEGPNPKLSADDERLISALIQNGADISDITLSPGMGSEARAASGVNSDARTALQYLVWCVSDTQALLAANPKVKNGEVNQTGVDVHNLCEAMNGPTEGAVTTTPMRTAILSTIPVAPSIELKLDVAPGPFGVGTAVPGTLTTNVFNTPITFAAVSGVTVTSNNARLEDGKLIVSGSGETPVTVTLTVTSAVAGSISAEASALPASTNHIVWNQSAQPEGGKECQRYASYRISQGTKVNTQFTVVFVDNTDAGATIDANSETDTDTGANTDTGSDTNTASNTDSTSTSTSDTGSDTNTTSTSTATATATANSTATSDATTGSATDTTATATAQADTAANTGAAANATSGATAAATANATANQSATATSNATSDTTGITLGETGGGFPIAGGIIALTVLLLGAAIAIRSRRVGEDA